MTIGFSASLHRSAICTIAKDAFSADLIRLLKTLPRLVCCTIIYRHLTNVEQDVAVPLDIFYDCVLRQVYGLPTSSTCYFGILVTFLATCHTCVHRYARTLPSATRLQSLHLTERRDFQTCCAFFTSGGVPKFNTRDISVPPL